MKRHITKEQWNELNTTRQKIILDWLLQKNLGITYLNTRWSDKSFFNIGIMIEFLGDDWDKIFKKNSSRRCIVKNISIKHEAEIEAEIIEVLLPSTEDLCDALWSAVKNKLNENSHN